MRRTLRLTVAGLLAATALGAAPPAHADPPDGSVDRLPAGKSWTVTLVTGDVVRVRTNAGKVPTVSVTPGEGRRSTAFATSIRPDGSIRVLPADVAPRVGKMLDPALFDVTGLIEQGFNYSAVSVHKCRLDFTSVVCS
ncbi:hypothetical protein [Actinomadura alba]|uniref:Uncharacterized protein n=1 Tax=Actinomadura alba TaxID=406431 RepID=A0ABR7M0V3_9ACTN|nr:hypothetical protein [Actinomadura alba]MBC6470750.1 hypothetical protein [Actinomadura alba]